MINLFESIPKLKILEDRKSPFLPNINNMVKYSETVLKEIKNTFDNYTNHDIEHSVNVIKYMCDAVSNLNELSDLEITIIIYVGLLHDIGMVVTDEEKQQIKNNNYKLSQYNYTSVLTNCNNNENMAIQEIIRPIHAIRSKNFISEQMPKQKHLFEVIGMNHVYFDETVGNICVSHNEEFEWIKLNLEKDIKLGQYTVNAQYIAVLLRLADLLDIDSSRTPDYLYDLISPSGISDDEWRQHFIITNSEKIVDSSDKLKYIEFYGSTKDAKIHRKLLNYIDWIKKEVENSTNFLNESSLEKYRLNISTNIRNMIKPQNFVFSNFKLSLDYKSITNLLMGENIYNDKKCGLREIIQNSIDACKLMKEEAKAIEEYKYNPYTPKIIIQIDNLNKSVTIFDNGIGMSFDIIKKYFLNVGVSYYTSNDCKYRGYSYTPIGNYGIGFLSCFMLSNNIRIKSKRFDSSDTLIVDAEKGNEYVIFNKSCEESTSFTKITLDETFFEIFKTVNDVKNYIEQTFLDDDIPIIIQSTPNENNSTNIKCNLISLKIPGKEIASLSPYLNGIEVSASLRKKIQYITSLDDISYNNYIYKNDRIIKYDASIHNINELISKNELNYVTVTFIPRCMREKFELLCEAFGDYKEAVDKFTSFDRLNIYFNSSNTVFCSYNDHIELEEYDDLNNIDYMDYIDSDSYYTKIFEPHFSVYKLLEQLDDCALFDTDIASVHTNIESKSVVSTDENTYLVFDKDYYNSWLSKEKRSLFVRNVLINKYHFILPAIASGIRIDNIIVNILNSHVIPDISRSNIQREITEQINYAIGKAIHLWIYDNVTLSYIEKHLLKEFINLKYGVKNEFINDKYNDVIR